MAKRVNTGFLLGLTVALVVLGGAGTFLKWKASHGDYHKHVDAANRFIQEGNYDAAYQEYLIAVSLDPGNKQLLIELGDVANHLVEDQGAAFVMAAMKSWENALDIDPRFKAALERLQASYVEQIEYFPINAPYEKFKDVAVRLTKVDPTDQVAAANVYIADIAKWESGVGTLDKPLAASIQALADIQKQDPANSESLFYLGRAKLHIARDARLAGDNDKADAQVAELRSILDATTAAQPQNAAVNYRAYRLYAYMSRTSPKPEEAKAQKEAGDAALARARANIKPADHLYEEIITETADRAIEAGKREEGEQIFREYYQQHQNDRFARLRYAEALRRSKDAAKREEAIRILRQPIVAQHNPGVRGVQVKQLEQQALEELLRLRLDVYAATTQPSERTAVMAQIDDTFKQISANVNGESVGLMRLKAQVQEAKGARFDSLETLKAAVKLMENNSVKPSFQYDLLYDLAMAYRNLGQNKAAEERLQQVLAAYANYLPARINLAELYIRENNFDEAKRQIDLLAAQSPQAPEISRLKLSLSLASRNGEESKQAYADLPEDTPPARQYKAEQARQLRDYAEMIRLVEPLLKEKPGDPVASWMLAQAYFLSDQKDKAREILTEAIAKNPGSSDLKVALQQVNGATPQQLQDFVNQQLVAKGDQYSVEVREANRADFEGRYDEALRHLKAADLIKPNQLSVWALYFDVYIRQRDYASADKAVGVIAPLDDMSGGRTYRWFLEMAQRHYDNAIKVAQDLTKTRGAVSGSWTCLGKAYEANQQYNDAIAQYDNALQIQDNDVDAYRGRAQCYNALGQPDEARRTLVTALHFLPNNQMLREMLMTHDTSHGNAVAIVPLRERMLAADPNSANSYYNLAYTAMAAADEVFAKDLIKANKFTGQAREVLSQGVEKFPDSIPLNAKLAELLQKSGNFDDGLAVLTKLAARPAYKDSAEPLRLQAEYFAAAGRNDEAEQYYRQALAKSNNDIGAELNLAQHLLAQQKFDALLEVLKTNASDPRIVQYRLQTLVSAKRMKEAQEGVDAELAKNPNDYFMLLLRLGIYVDQQRFDDARKVSRQVLALDPKSTMGLFFQALAEMRDPNGGDLELALNDLNSVVGRAPADLQARVQLAEVYRKRNEPERAVAQLEESLKVKDERPQAQAQKREVRLMLLQIYLDRANWQGFEQAVQEAELNPSLNSDPVWYYLHAQALAKQADFPHAIEKIQQAMSLGKGDTRFDREFLQILLQSPDKGRVLIETDKVIAGGNKTWWIYEARGRARSALGDKPRATEELDQALALADTAKDVDGAATVFRTIGETLGYDEALKRLAGRIDTENYWRLLAVDLHARSADWAGAIQTVQPLLDQLPKLSAAERLQALQFAAESNHVLGESESANGPHQQAAKALYVKWLDMEAMNRKALNNMAYLLAEGMKNPKEAKQYSQRAYDAERRNGNPDPNITDTHGWVLTLCGGTDGERGMDILRGLVDSKPDFVEAHYHLGMAFLNKQRPADALVELTTASEKFKAQEQTIMQTAPQLKAQIAEGIKRAQDQGGAKTDASGR